MLVIVWFALSASASAQVLSNELIPPTSTGEPPSTSDVDITLRLQVVSDSPRRFDGHLYCTSGLWSDLSNLGMDATTTGAYWLNAESHELAIQPRTATDRLGIDVRFRGAQKSLLRFRMELRERIDDHSGPRSEPAIVEIDIPLEQLLVGPFERELSPGVRLWIGRPPGDALRLEFAHHQSSLIFDAGEPTEWRLSAMAPGELPARQLMANIVITRDSDGSEVWRREIKITEEQSAPLRSSMLTRLAVGQFAMPTVEGVYTAHLSLTAPPASRLLPPFTPAVIPPSLLSSGAETIAERSVQFVVLEQLPPPNDSTPFRELRRWTPTVSTSIAAHLNPTTLLNRQASGPVGDAAVTDGEVAGHQVVELPPGTTLAQELPIDQVGRPHLIKVRYHRAEATRLVICVRQSNAAGQMSPLGVDSAVVDNGQTESNPDAEWAEHELVFWPRTSAPTVILHNSSLQTTVRVESIAVEAGPDRLAGGHIDAEFHRLAAVYFDKPLLADAFSAPKPYEPSAGTALDDWNTFLAAGQRLIEQTLASGSNSIVINAFSEGGALYPSRHCLVTPRYDTGAFFADGRDPQRKDILELLMRLCNRSGLKLVPAIELATPLPELEQIISRAQRQGTGEEVGLRWTDAVGRPLVDQQTARHGLAPYYNVLDPRVRAEIAKIVQELSQRYQHHPSMAGVGLQLGSQTYLQLPGPRWGRDARTLERFRNDLLATSTPNVSAIRQLPTAADSSNLPASTPTSDTIPANGVWLNRWIDEQGSQAFIAWRSRILGDYLSELSQLTAGRPLVLVTADYVMYETPTIAAGAPDQGLDWRRLANEPNIVPLRVVRDRWLLEPATRMNDAKMNEDFTWDDMLRGGDKRSGAALDHPGRAGGLLFVPPQELVPPITSEPLRKLLGGTAPTLFPQATQLDWKQRRRVSRLLDGVDARMVAIGGWTSLVSSTRLIDAKEMSNGPAAASPQFESELMTSWLSAFGALPDFPMLDVPTSSPSQALARVRQWRGPQSSVVYANNPSPWAIQLQIGCDAPPGTTVVQLGATSKFWRLGDGDPGAARPVNGPAPLWSGTLQPGELIALEIRGVNGGAVDWRSSPANPQLAMQQAAEVIERTTNRVAVLGRPREVVSPQNAGFEIGTAEKIDGWLRAQHPPGCVELSTLHFEGERSIVLRNAPAQLDGTWILSEPFQPPRTGRMAISVRARTIEGTPVVRLAIEGKMRGQPVRYSAEFRPQSSDEWGTEPFWLRVAHFPVNDLTEARVAIDLGGDGSVAIDDLRFHDFFFTQRERDELQRQTFVAGQQLRNGDLAPAARLLDSHWTRYLQWIDQRRELAPSSPYPPETPPAEATLPSEAPASTPGIAERIRQWLPSTSRF